MPNNETKRIAYKYGIDKLPVYGNGFAPVPQILSALSEMRTVALREAAEIANEDAEGCLNMAALYDDKKDKEARMFHVLDSHVGKRIRQAILGRIDK